MSVNPKRNTMDKEKRPQTVNTNNNNLCIDEFRLYINNLENLLRDTLNENVKLKQQLNGYTSKKKSNRYKKITS